MTQVPNYDLIRKDPDPFLNQSMVIQMDIQRLVQVSIVLAVGLVFMKSAGLYPTLEGARGLFDTLEVLGYIPLIAITYFGGWRGWK